MPRPSFERNPDLSFHHDSGDTDDVVDTLNAEALRKRSKRAARARQISIHDIPHPSPSVDEQVIEKLEPEKEEREEETVGKMVEAIKGGLAPNKKGIVRDQPKEHHQEDIKRLSQQKSSPHESVLIRDSSALRESMSPGYKHPLEFGRFERDNKRGKDSQRGSYIMTKRRSAKQRAAESRLGK